MRAALLSGVTVFQARMTNFDLDMTHFKPALAIVAAHGMTDLHTQVSLPCTGVSPVATPVRNRDVGVFALRR